MNLAISERGNTIELLGRSDEERKITPVMFSFEKHGDTKNRAIIRAEDSIWSQPMSFDALGQSNEVKLQITGKQMEIDLGVTVSEGEGKYNLTKVISITPRYIFVNKLEEELQIVEVGTTKHLSIKSGGSLPLWFAHAREKEFDDEVPTSIRINVLVTAILYNDVGQMFVKVLKRMWTSIGESHDNARRCNRVYSYRNGNDQWPFSIRTLLMKSSIFTRTIQILMPMVKL